MGCFVPASIVGKDGKRYELISSEPRKGDEVDEVDDQLYRMMQKNVDAFQAGKIPAPHYERDIVTYMGFLAWQKVVKYEEYEASLEDPAAYPHIWSCNRRR